MLFVFELLTTEYNIDLGCKRLDLAFAGGSQTEKFLYALNIKDKERYKN